MDAKVRQEKAAELYELILRTANKFLYNCTTFQITTLQGHNPTYDEIAQHLETLGKIIIILCEDPMMGQKAEEYCGLMTRMAIAIRVGDEAALAAAVEEMKQRPGT